MPATALRLVEQSSFRAEIVKYVAYACRQGRVKRGDIDDVVQQIWMEVIASIPTFRPEKGDFGNWVRGIALNVIRHHARDKERYAKRFSEYRPNVNEHAALEPSPERCAQRKQARCTISNVLENLSAQQANVFLLHAVDDMSHGDIGKELGISEAASQKCFQRTRNQLAQCISGELLSAMPPLITGCDDPASREVVSRWHDWSHYSGQITAAVLAFLLFIPSNRAPHAHASTSGEIRTQNDSMYHLDKHSGVQDEPAALRDAPVGKLEPAFLPSVRAVPVRTSVADKPAPFQPSAPLPPYKHTVRPSVHPPLGR